MVDGHAWVEPHHKPLPERFLTTAVRIMCWEVYAMYVSVYRQPSLLVWCSPLLLLRLLLLWISVSVCCKCKATAALSGTIQDENDSRTSFRVLSAHEMWYQVRNQGPGIPTAVRDKGARKVDRYAGRAYCCTRCQRVYATPSNQEQGRGDPCPPDRCVFLHRFSALC